MSGAQGYTLTAGQQIRLAVFQGISSWATDIDLIVEIVNEVSAAIIGEDKQDAEKSDDAQVVYEGIAQDTTYFEVATKRIKEAQESACKV